MVCGHGLACRDGRGRSGPPCTSPALAPLRAGGVRLGLHRAAAAALRGALGGPQLSGRIIAGSPAQGVAPVRTELDAYSRSERVSRLGDGVEPGSLAAPAHQEQIPVADLKTESAAA